MMRYTYIYISGPMRSHANYNFPAFFEAEERLRREFPKVAIFNPARQDCERYMLSESLRIDPTGHSAGLTLRRTEPDFDLREALASDLMWIAQECNLMVMLPGWEESKGAVAEHALADALGIRVWEYGHETTDVYTEESAEPVASFSTPTLSERILAADTPDAMPTSWDEERITSATGGQKGVKLAAFDQVSPEIEMLVAEHFGKGARKYSAHNFRKGYEWSKSYSALRRHLAAFWAGEEYDNHLADCPEGCTDHTGSRHIVAVIWHAMVLAEFSLHHKEFDDRYVYE